MAIVLRSNKGVALTQNELDGNFTDLNSRVTSLESGGAFRNLIINGDMSIAQRGTSAIDITGIINLGYHTVDRLGLRVSASGTWTMSQETDVPNGQGFAKSAKIECTSAKETLFSGNFINVVYKFEGQNLQYLKKGTSSAESLTLSFWVKSNKTGTYIAELYDIDNARHLPKSYTINSADTWEKKTITYPGDTSGTLDNDNNNSLQISLWLGAGSNYTSGTLANSWQSAVSANRAVGQVNLADTVGNEWYITGVQLEDGTTASDFEFLPYDVNLGRCLRYYELLASSLNEYFADGLYYNSTTLYSIIKFRKNMRTSPSLEIITGTNYYRFTRDNYFDVFDSLTLGSANDKLALITTDSGVSGTGGQAGVLRTNTEDAFIAFNAEL